MNSPETWGPATLIDRRTTSSQGQEKDTAIHRSALACRLRHVDRFGLSAVEILTLAKSGGSGRFRDPGAWSVPNPGWNRGTSGLTSKAAKSRGSGSAPDGPTPN